MANPLKDKLIQLNKVIDVTTLHGYQCQHCNHQLNLLISDANRIPHFARTYKKISYVITMGMGWCAYLSITPEQAEKIRPYVHGGFTIEQPTKNKYYLDTCHMNDFVYTDYYIRPPNSKICPVHKTFKTFEWLDLHIKSLIERLTSESSELLESSSSSSSTLTS